jgi:hypothetical protein
MSFRLVVLPLLLALAACSSSSSPATSGDPTNPDPPPADTETPPAATPPAQPPPPPTDACGTVAKSKCTPANPGSVVRGIVKFDPARYAGKPTPALRVFMHHQFVLRSDENKTGGHPHAFTTSDKIDMVKGEAHFSIDLCELGTAMYSEENCGFNIIALLDENGNNDPDTGGVMAFVPDKGELLKMVPVDVSCRGASQCLSIVADCADGDVCTTYTPPTECKCAATTCPSDDKICK